MADANLSLTLAGVHLGVLDLAPVPEGSTAGDALRATIYLAQKTEDLGFTRFWVAEHHGMPGVASSSPPVLIGHLADATRTIRVGSGGVMLPNHSALVGSPDTVIDGLTDLIKQTGVDELMITTQTHTTPPTPALLRVGGRGRPRPLGVVDWPRTQDRDTKRSSGSPKYLLLRWRRGQG